MARAEVPSSLEEIRSPRSTTAHIVALKQLKHDIIGHEQRKELVVHYGLVRLLVRDLATRPTSATNSQQSAMNTTFSTPDTLRSHDSLQEVDQVWLQCAQIVTCLAHGGLAFVHPLLAAGVLPHLLACLSPSSVPPRLIVESLRALSTIGEAMGTDILSSPESSALAQLASQLFTKPNSDALAEILAQRQALPIVDEQIKLVLRLICVSLRDSRGAHEAALVKAGVLDFICCRLASMVVDMGHNTQTLQPAFVVSILPALPRSSLQYLLEALAALCRGSAYRSMRILYSRHLLEAFPIASRNRRTPGEYLSFSDQASSPPLNSNPMDYLLPKLQAVQSKNEHSFSKAFPALGAFVGSSEISRMPYYSESHTMVSSRTISADEFGSPLIAWLIHLARTTHGLEKLATLEFLTGLVSALDQKIMDSWSESSRNRDRTLAFLVVPLLVCIIENTDPKNLLKSKASIEELAVGNIVRERAPLALAILIKECPALQKAAHDASAIKGLCQMLKKSFDPVATMRTPMWTANPTSSVMEFMGEFDDTLCSLGSPAMSAENVHRFRCRAASLRALAAIAQKEDQYRRNVLDQTIISCLVDSLNPYPDGPVSAAASDASGKEGNPWFVITAACRLAQALSRSVGVLRTSLIDAGIAKPIFKLLKEHDARVRGAGTDVVTNLVLHFSPMREELLRQGIVTVLCDHAHSADPRLRFSALWALKHLCASTPNDIKIGILDELGTGWLIQTISGETSSTIQGRAHMATPNAAGEQVDLLNAVDEPIMDIDEEAMDSSEDDDRGYSDGITMRIPTIPTRYRTRLRAIKQEEESPVLRAKKDDVRITSQALDLVRNLISEVGPKQPTMIDHLLQAMGSTRFFECIASKLKPRPRRSSTSNPSPAGKRPTLTTPSSASTSSTVEKDRLAHAARIESFPRESYMDDELVLSALFVLIHIGNGKPHHRHSLLNLTTALPIGTMVKLLDLTLPLFSHPEPKIRVACCWMVHNVMWMEDSGDAAPARQRALELRSRGFEEVVRGCLGDSDLDVRERARGCVDIWGRVGIDGERGSGRSWER